MTALEKNLGEAINKLFTAEPQKEPTFEVDKNVYKICYFGTPKTGYDIQIIEYRIQYLGKDKFLPYGFEHMTKPELDFYSCYSSFEAAMEECKRRHGDDVEFKFDAAKTFCTVYVKERNRVV